MIEARGFQLLLALGKQLLQQLRLQVLLLATPPLLLLLQPPPLLLPALFFASQPVQQPWSQEV
jgi:hypothetical protein